MECPRVDTVMRGLMTGKGRWAALFCGVSVAPCSCLVLDGPRAEAAGRKPDRRVDSTRRSKNPAGCEFENPSMDGWDGVFPVGDFKSMLDKPTTVDRQDGCSDINLALGLKWCPYPEVITAFKPGSRFTKAAERHLAELLDGMDTSKPLVVSVFGGSVKDTAKGVQVANFLCGLERLGLASRALIVATDGVSEHDLRLLQPRARVIYSEAVQQVVWHAMQTTNLDRSDRVFKLVVSKLLVNLSYDLILSDMDIYWVRDPTPAFQHAADTEGLELAAMKDGCWLELNSGFVYYRSTPAVRRMLDIALSTYRQSGMCADNDQYLLNCGFAHAAVQGLKYRMLHPNDFAAGSSHAIGGERRCGHKVVLGNTTGRYLGDGLPYVWHTYGFTTNYLPEMDMLTAFGLVDVDTQTGKCLEGQRGAVEDALRLREKSSKSCQNEDVEGAFYHHGCYGTCQTDPFRTDKLIQAWRQTLQHFRAASQ